MDFHILIIIACVFLASLFSLLFINKFFRRKTFEEIVAEKKAMTEKIYGPAKAAKKQARAKLPTKKELKKEKRQRQQKKAEDNTTEVDDSDAQSENPSVEEDSPRPEQQHEKPSKKIVVQPAATTHVEFASEAEVVDSDNGSTAGQRRSSADSNNQKTNKSNKQRKSANTKSAGILANKNEQTLVKEVKVEEDEEVPLNNFEAKPPKDVLELKKQENFEAKKTKEPKKSNKNQAKKENQLPVVDPIEVLSVAKDLKQLDEKPVRAGSPKNQSNKLKQQNKKKNDKENVALDNINDNDTIGVSLLMNLFGRAELNRSEIQILIDYLLNKQQDMPASHSEWSDDIVQKLKKQLEEKEKALHEEQEASVGIQAKLRELRTEINTERAQMTATVKSYIEEIQGKKNELAAMSQEMQNLNDKFALERQQFQNKLRLEKQAGSQDVLLQLQRESERLAILQGDVAHRDTTINDLKNEMAHKDQCIHELKCLVNASNQGAEENKQKTSEIIQTQVNQIHVLEQKLDEAEVLINEQRYALDQAKTTEGEHETNKVELRNLQNALDSKQAELDMALNELGDKQQEIDTLNLQKQELIEELGGINSRVEEERSKEQNDLQNTLDVLQTTLEEKDKKLTEYEVTLKKMGSKTDDLLKLLEEQREKNNDLRTKNWKLVDALQAAETAKKQISKSLVQQQQQLLLSQQQQQQKVAIQSSDPAKDQKQIREILERLYPDAVKASAGSALSLSFDQWIEQVLATQVKQSISKNSATTATNTTSTNTPTATANSNSSSKHSSHNHNNLNSSEDTKNSSVSINNSSSVSSSSSNSDDTESSRAADKAEILKLKSQNAQLRANSEELTKLVTKTGNTLLELEARAREQEDIWRGIVRSKEEEINLLKHSNGEEQDI